MHVRAELARGRARPRGAAQQLTAEQDGVGLAVGEDLLGLLHLGDEADGGHGQLRLGLHARGEGDLVAGADRDAHDGRVAAGRDVEQIDAVLLEEGGEAHGLLGRPAVLLRPVGGGDAEEERLVVGPHGADRVDDLEGEAHPVVEGAAVLVRADVGVRREELADQVAVRAVDLGDLEARVQGATGALGELGDDLADPLHGELGRGGVPVVEGERARRDRLPAVRVGSDGAAALQGRSVDALRPAYASLSEYRCTHGRWRVAASAALGRATRRRGQAVEPLHRRHYVA